VTRSWSDLPTYPTRLGLTDGLNAFWNRYQEALFCTLFGLSIAYYIQFFVGRYFAPRGEITTHNKLSTMLPQVQVF